MITFLRDGAANYKLAKEKIKEAKECIYAIYCVPTSPDERPGKESEFVEYFNEVNRILVEESIEYWWLVGVYDISLLKSLLNRVKMLLSSEMGKKSISRNLSRFRALDMIGVRGFVPINFQVIDFKNVVLGYPTHSLNKGVEAGFALEDEKVADSMSRYFERLWSSAIPIIEEGTIYIENLRKLFDEIRTREKQLQMPSNEINEVTSALGLIEHRITGNAFLSGVPPELSRNVDTIKENITYSFSLIKSRFPNHAPHDEEHVKRVANTNLIKVFHKDELIFHLNPVERYLLLVAAYCHDIGMGVDGASLKEIIRRKYYNRYRWYDLLTSDFRSIIEDELKVLSEELSKEARDRDIYEIRRLIRKYHAILGGASILRNWKKIGITDYQHAEIVAYLVSAHSRKTEIFKLPEEVRVNNQKLRLRFLAVVLRLADALDLEYRANVKEYDWKSIHKNESDQTKHWVYKLLITGISILEEGGAWIIAIYHDAVNRDEFEGLTEFEGVSLAEELEIIKGVLSPESGLRLPFKSVLIKRYREEGYENITENLDHWRKKREEDEKNGRIGNIANEIVERLSDSGIIR